MSDKLVTVTSFGTEMEAEIARNALEAAGVRAFLQDQATVGNVWHLGNALGGIKLQVAEDDAEEARAVLAGDGDTTAVAVQERGWICPTCRSEIEPGFEICWSCGRQFEVGDERQRIEPDPTHPEEGAASARIPVAPRPLRDEPDTASAADLLAERAWRGAIIGLFAAPPLMHLYSLTLLLRMAFGREKLSEQGVSHTFGALVIDVATIAAVITVLSWLF